MAQARLGKYECLACGYVYDPELGDLNKGVEPGTPFEELPEDWVCPECGVAKELFEPIVFHDLSADVGLVDETSPETAPQAQKYECLACGYIYDPLRGDPRGGIAPGTPFGDLPDDWACPECGAGKELFEVIG